MKELHSEHKPSNILPNIATLLKKNVRRFGDNVVYQEKNKSGEYVGITWRDFYDNIEKIAFNLKKAGFAAGDKMVLFSNNRLELLEMELALMASGGIAVPIFAYFKEDTAGLLIKHSDATWLAVAGKIQLDNLPVGLNLKKIFVFDDIESNRFDNIVLFSELLKSVPVGQSAIDDSISPSTICLNMYTSGTMGTPKCVQLTHNNILSQQAALGIVWDINETDRFLSYLPWHHSFGGIFELFCAIYHGAVFSRESSYGKDPQVIFDNWKKVKPTVFFSVPKVYQALVEKTRESKEAEDIFFNSGLKFIFTAAAALPEKLSVEFEKRKIPVIEGWGLTETSPCCTLTDPNLKRQSGVVGKPLPGVSIRIAEDDEIQVKGPNVMPGYYKNDDANKTAFTNDNWYRTGDVGAITKSGVKLIARKDRIFKLSNGEKVVPTDLEKAIQLRCHYVQHIIISGSGEEFPVALIFPNKKLLENPDYHLPSEKGCLCPSNVSEFSKCLQGCLHDANCDIKQKFSKIRFATVINRELSLDDNTLTPSMKVAPKNVLKKYKNLLLKMYGKDVPNAEEVYVVKLDPKNNIMRTIV